MVKPLVLRLREAVGCFRGAAREERGSRGRGWGLFFRTVQQQVGDGYSRSFLIADNQGPNCLTLSVLRRFAPWVPWLC